MANKKIDMLQLKQLLRLYTQGVSKLQISSQLGLSRNTVKKYITLFTTSKFTYEEIKELNDTDIEDLFDTKELDSDEKEAILYKYFPYFTKELLKTGVTRHILWQEYLLKHPEGYRYSQFCYHLRTWQKKHLLLYTCNTKLEIRCLLITQGKSCLLLINLQEK